MFFTDFAKAVLAEDIGRGDLFERVAQPVKSAAKIVAKSQGLFAGKPYAQAIADLSEIEIVWEKEDGEEFSPKETLARVYGYSTAILKAERSLLNTLLHASSIATKARRLVQAAGGKIRVLDTRKTRPLLREFEKYAARIGGVVNHRLGLDDCLMIKDTHLKTIDQDLATFICQAREKIPFTAKIEVESESYEDAIAAMQAGADIVMCDNMNKTQIERVVAYRDENFPHVLLEASGNIDESNIKEYIEAGVDAISSGSIVHQATWPDISMKMEG